MNNIYIKKSDLNHWVAKYFKKDLISIDDLIACIEYLESEIDDLTEELEDKENDYPNEESDREKYVFRDEII